MMQKYFFLHVALQFSQNHCDKTIFIKIHERVGNNFALNNNDNEKFTVSLSIHIENQSSLILFLCRTLIL